MINHYPAAALGHGDHGWLKSRFHFSFADYHNPARVRFGRLRVINDDWIAAGSGFDPHPHQNMEIITYVRSGAVLHRDSLGNSGRTGAGDVQVMSAGTGITHAEYADPAVDTTLFQIWIFPDVRDVAPRWEQAAFAKEPVDDRLRLLVSGDRADAAAGALFIHAPSRIYGGVMAPGHSLTHIAQGPVYAVMSAGSVRLNGVDMMVGDGAEITDIAALELVAGAEGAEILLIEQPEMPA